MNITVNRGAPVWDAIILAYGGAAAQAVAELATALMNAKNQGHQEGFEAGYKIGIEDSFENGFQSGYEVAHEVFYESVAIEMQRPTVAEEDLQFSTDEINA